ncbi:MAG: non-homologous end-joining DNA ligase [Chthoniobacterales bacterium]
MSLKEYIRKRNFSKTAEPRGKKATSRGVHRFVIQKHAASHLHYDFRLEMGGTLKSWAVPKGIPFAKGEKRLAMEVEDHPVSYIDFEGTIPKGQYGGGTVMVWDKGTYEPLSKTPTKELAGGKLHFVLDGEKLKGEWYLVRMRDGKAWLLIRGDKDMKPISRKRDDLSALSGKTMKELAKGDRIWKSKSATGYASKKKKRSNAPLPQFVEPMQAKLVDKVPAGDWIYEIKFDGFRALALRGENEIRLMSRNEKDFGAKFPEVMDSLAKLKVKDAILDGEIVALDEKGRSSFQLLQAYELGQERPPLYFYAFDLLQLNGKALLDLPLSERKAKLQTLLKKPPGIIRYSGAVGKNAESLLKKMRILGLEGLIGKKVNSSYEVRRRSGAWIKLKLHHEQEFVIGGYSEPEGSRKHFGALLIGVYKNKQLHFTGKVGTGFNNKLLRSLYKTFKSIARRDCPFVNLPEKRRGRYGAGVTASVMKHCHWLMPEMVCQIKFSEWTRDDKLRQPVFLGLREDKEARDVIREKAS